MVKEKICFFCNRFSVTYHSSFFSRKSRMSIPSMRALLRGNRQFNNLQFNERVFLHCVLNLNGPLCIISDSIQSYMIWCDTFVPGGPWGPRVPSWPVHLHITLQHSRESTSFWKENKSNRQIYPLFTQSNALHNVCMYII